MRAGGGRAAGGRRAQAGRAGGRRTGGPGVRAEGWAGDRRVLRRSCVLGQVGRSFEYFNSAVDFSPEKTRCTGAGDGEEGAGRDMGGGTGV